MATCKEISKLISESHDRPLSWIDRVKIRLHLAMCFICRNFSKQVDMIRTFGRAIGRSGHDSLVSDGSVLDQSLSPEAKSRIKNALSPNS